jgi:uncharacterized membrane protein YgcG
MPKPSQTLALRTFPQDCRLSFILVLILVMMLTSFSFASAEMRVVSSQGEYRMGDRDTKEDAVRLATEAAKRNALEQVATYLESVTIVEGVDVTKDEIRTYTAGLVLVLDQQVHLMLEEDTVVVTVDLTSQVDTEDVIHAIVALRENEDARHQLVALRNEIDDLHNKLESANQALASATTVEEAQQATIQRQEILNQVQSNAMVSQAWTDWVIAGPVAYPYPWGGVAPPLALLSAARGLYPTSPYVQTAQNVIVTNQLPPTQQQPIPPPVRQPLSQPGVRQVPLTLNEISHTTPTTSPMHLGNQPTGTTPSAPVSTGSRSMPHFRRINPFLTPPHGGQQTIPGSRSLQSLHQFLQPPATVPPSAQPPAARRLPPTTSQIRPSLPHQVPRMPYLGPRSFGGGGYYGGGGRGGGGGGRGGGSHGGGRGR